MHPLTRWFAPTLLAAGLACGALVPTPAFAQDSLSRVLVDVADVVFNGGTPYYRYGNYAPDDRLLVDRDAYGRPIYYRNVMPRQNDYRYAPPYGNAYGYYQNGPGSRMHCNKHGKCKGFDHDGDDRGRYDHYRRDHDGYDRDDGYDNNTGRDWRDRGDDRHDDDD